ncbi:hypothetical protein FPOA_09823 [Fusarium poae]|uniref:Uncharacterized protein n=1 Tax=Fusarium poae TaxID=36050 RepID=A0A1B8ACC1_FUSPO|nr:hypothetical protein FPOA_09823 [Fusarium poae]
MYSLLASLWRWAPLLFRLTQPCQVGNRLVLEEDPLKHNPSHNLGTQEQKLIEALSANHDSEKKVVPQKGQPILSEICTVLDCTGRCIPREQPTPPSPLNLSLDITIAICDIPFSLGPKLSLASRSIALCSLQEYPFFTLNAQSAFVILRDR